MNVFEQYVGLLRMLLPKAQRDDVIRELSEEYRSQAAEKEAALGRPLTVDEQAGIVAQFGHPLLMAARYWPQRHLIGPALFPFYGPALKVTLAITLLVHAISVIVLFISGAPAADLASSAEHLLQAMLAVFAWVTIAFAIADRQVIRSRVLEKWKPGAVPSPMAAPARRAAGAADQALASVHHEFGSARDATGADHHAARPGRPSLSAFIVGVVFGIWWLLALRIPELMFGGGAAIVSWGSDMARLYPVLAIAQVTVLAESFVRLARPDARHFFRVTRAIWIVNSAVFVYFLLTLDHQWVVWRAPADARALFTGIIEIAGRQLSLVEVINYALTIPFVVAVSIGVMNTIGRMFGAGRRRPVSGAASMAVVTMLSAVFVPAAAAQIPGDAEIRQILADRIDVQRQSLGIVVGIVTPEGRRVIAHGRVGRDDARPMNGDTVFEIGSVTKVFTAVLLADMARRGEVTLTDPIGRYLPPGLPTSRGRAITLADLATHTSGLPFWPSNIPPTAEGTKAMATYTLEQLYRFAAEFEPPADSGSKWAYSNTDTGLLGALLARRAGSSYEALLMDRITIPLRMPSTAVAVSAAMRARLAAGHDGQLQPAERWDVPSLPGAGSLHSTVNDLLTFLAAAGDGTSVIATALPTMLATRRQAPGFQQAIGWMLLSTAPGDEGFLLHDGSTRGFASSIVYDPRTRTGVVVLSNTVSSVADIARHLLRPAIPRAKPAGPAPVKTEVTIDRKWFDLYAGEYEPGPGAVFTVSREDDALLLQLPGLPKFRLRPESERTFFVAENARVSVTFDVNAGGEVTGLLLRAPTGDVPATRRRGRSPGSGSSSAPGTAGDGQGSVRTPHSPLRTGRGSIAAARRAGRYEARATMVTISATTAA